MTNEHVWACTVDAVQQVCIGIGTKVDEIRRNVPPAQAFIKPSLKGLRDWLNEAATITECMTTFIVDTGLSPYDCANSPSRALDDTTWTFSKADHGLIHNPFLRIDWLEVTDVAKPELGAAECTDNTDNDSFIPLEVGPIVPEWTRLILAEGSVDLIGPAIDGVPTEASGTLTSALTQCSPDTCSSLALEPMPGSSSWRLEALQLHSTGASAAVHDSTVVDEYTISLFSPVAGVMDANGAYRIEPGRASLVISGKTALGDYVLPVTNAGPIVLEPSPNGWTLSALTVVYEDQRGDDWQLTVTTSGWIAP